MENLNLSTLSTEKRNQKSLQLDELTSKEALILMNQEDSKVSVAVAKVIPMIDEVVQKVIEVLSTGGRLIYMGAGTSGRLGVLDAVECRPTFGTSDDQIIGLIAGGNDAMFRAHENIEDQPKSGADDLKAIHLTEHDIVVGIAASGRTPYVIGGLQYASEIGAQTVGLVCNLNSPIKQIAQMTIEVDCGPEVLTGSTRLKAGTAQKLILNMISTVSMIGLGKVYQNLMVDVQPTNEKLRERSLQILMEATDISRNQAKEIYERANNNLKVAILMQLLDVTIEEAQRRLKQENGHVKKALDMK
ncbi:N-acetylmuramic acid 6-phosphate etherase [Enterococcus columbae]|uniref:N-acetylmuramic acid 6-phosphate etherase n=1 Tax=Enterococcus columbae DSM 7374 = ATCC 51263 TaxID=1121865 RepID=S0KHC4_9ENTE|nr:N-acetylmuramic acid 6-phosphate etherase [Enterococcus columbae]EOT44234.1 N-acetylmuramic acid 6-phosphate etherase [Enterococcus columbae DSM 7374 = ATCC 51263]EOW84392.1 N-acetylmuramic acid 6-phosphate etherase [Enterococcus columbae DSM 7374 = ATCC 51263]OJG26048.1 N-acetylmuramic acid 6-phosphate etherase [Enterococcus columbae DSM 7374 = ATCC 51263]